MSETILTAEPTIRLTVFLGVLVGMALWEVAAPRRRQEVPRVVRWTNNLALVLVDTVILRFTFPILTVGLAVMSEDRGWGVLNTVDLPLWVVIPISMLVLDLAIYLQHVLFHAVPGLWRRHRMHHADLDSDAPTGLRFHPLEIPMSMGIKLAVVAALGPPAIAMLLFEVLLNATALFNHANIRLPARVDRVLRLVVVTPDMHRVHHLVIPAETNINFGFNLPWWDRLLGTYRAQPKAGHEGMTIGIEQFRNRRDIYLDRMLVQPLRGPASGGALTLRDEKSAMSRSSVFPSSLYAPQPTLLRSDGSASVRALRSLRLQCSKCVSPQSALCVTRLCRGTEQILSRDGLNFAPHIEHRSANGDPFSAHSRGRLKRQQSTRMAAEVCMALTVFAS